MRKVITLFTITFAIYVAAVILISLSLGVFS